MTATRCGYAAIVGRPNVGKSTLLNHVLGQKISITSRKPQTTRHQVLGIKTEEQDGCSVQAIYVDTPGLHKRNDKAINRYMNRAASSAIKDVDVVVFVVDRLQWTDEDDWVLEQLKQAGRPCILAVNKIDLLDDKGDLLPGIEALASRHNFEAIVPVSAFNADDVAALEQAIAGFIPEGMHFFDEDQVTDRSSRFLAAELVREKIMRQLGDELPYAATVEIEEFEDDGKTLHISALILVERAGQKKIIIGDGGSRIRQIGQEARKDMEQAFEQKVMLRTWVKVKSGWSDDERALQSLGYTDR